MRQRPNIIALTGYAQAGKTTAAEYLSRSWGYRPVAFADALRNLTEQLDPVVDGVVNTYRYRDAVERFGYEGAKRSIPGLRDFLKRLGNGARDVLGKDVWVDAAFRGIRRGDNVVIQDCRFLNEAAAVRDRGGIIIRIARPGVTAESDFEREVDRIKSDFLVVNDRGISDFFNSLSAVMTALGRETWEQLELAG